MSNYHIKQFYFGKALQLETAVRKPGSRKKEVCLTNDFKNYNMLSNLVRPRKNKVYMCDGCSITCSV